MSQCTNTDNLEHFASVRSHGQKKSLGRICRFYFCCVNEEALVESPVDALPGRSDS
jgi:hypothetical protein